MNTQQTHKSGNLLVWQKAHEFVLEIYKYTKTFPKYETYCLGSQFTRSAISIPINVEQSTASRIKKDKVNFLDKARLAVERCRYFLILANDLDYGTPDEAYSRLEETSKLLTSFAKAVIKSA